MNRQVSGYVLGIIIGAIGVIFGIIVSAEFFIYVGVAIIALSLLCKLFSATLGKRIKKSLGKYYPSFIVFVVLGYVVLVATSVCAIGFIFEWDFDTEAVWTLVISNIAFGILTTYLYFLPYLVANKKNHTQKRAIYILNVLLGWTFLGWVISLIWACTESKENKIVQVIEKDNAEEIRKYKELLDSGVITQEEFEMKKRQLLNL